MMRATVGVAVHAEPERLRQTLDSLERFTTGREIEVALLADDPDQPTRSALAALGHVRRIVPDAPGMPACFNALARESDGDLIVLLESGSIVGPEWLGRLVEALEADPANGLAGPSTNRAWNEQRVFPAAQGTLADVGRRAAEARQRYGGQSRSLAPLHSLADFCYAVRREVIAAIGGADEGYGTGPCWEMDYNIRAWRAGFAGVWAMSAYVYRHPFTARRARDEARCFPASRTRYQDKFCGLRLRRERMDYEPGCRGEACEHFAPAELIQLRLPPALPAPACAGAVGPAPPLVSCVMPTQGRSDFVQQSVAYFLRQRVTAAELIILDDGPRDLAPDLPRDPRIRYFRQPPDQTIGAKRNRGVELARGRYIAHWDDDDWYAPTRLETQLAPLLAGTADVSGLTGVPFFDLPAWTFWQVTAGLHRRLFVQDVHGGTLMYDRRVWERGCRYPPLSLAEDAHFLTLAIRRGARLARIPGERECLYLRHAHNSWRFSCGRFLDPNGWRPVAEPPLPAGDREFYRRRSASGPADVVPLVSCIMPTADRRPFVSRAVQYFLRQDYPAAELIVLDDGDAAAADLLPADPRIRYERLPRRTVLGTKRNLACEMARGDLLMHWDDDDWSAPDRITRQAGVLTAAPGVEVCGLAALLFYDAVAGQGWRYRYRLTGRAWVAGNTMCYRREVWKRMPFAAVPEGEDTRFVWALEPRQVRALPEPDFFVGILHQRNTSSRRRRDPAWSSVDVEEIRRIMGADLATYEGWEAGDQLSRSSQPQV